MGASVKIMLSYDYCHFEVCKSTDDGVNDKQIDEMRKDCQRLADKAVEQYKIAKECAARRQNGKYEAAQFAAKVRQILEKPEGERTVNDYEDDFNQDRLKN
jgi:hypothetical protein